MEAGEGKGAEGRGGGGVHPGGPRGGRGQRGAREGRGVPRHRGLRPGSSGLAGRRVPGVLARVSVAAGRGGSGVGWQRGGRCGVGREWTWGLVQSAEAAESEEEGGEVRCVDRESGVMMWDGFLFWGVVEVS